MSLSDFSFNDSLDAGFRLTCRSYWCDFPIASNGLWKSI